MAADNAELDQHVARVVDSLAERFTRHDPQVVEEAVAHARAALEPSTRHQVPARPGIPTRCRPARRPRLEELAVVADQRRTLEPSETQATWSPTLGPEGPRAE